MTRRLNENITLDFTTHNPLTGDVSDADSIPTCELFEEDSDTPILTPAVTKRSGKTGDYRVTFILSDANGFEASKAYNAIATVVVGGKTAKARIASFSLEPLPPVPPAHFVV